MTRTQLARAGLVMVATAVFTVDQVTKSLAVHLVDDRVVEWGPVSLAVSRNSGGPFGVGSSMSAVWFGLAMLGAVVAVWAAAQVDRVDALTVSAAIVAGGVFGNLADRLARGRAGGVPGVIDWITVDPYPFTFNVADVALRGGALALIVAAVRRTDGAADCPVARLQVDAIEAELDLPG